MSLGSSMKDVLHVTDNVADPPILESVQADLRNPAARTKARDVARNVLSDVAPSLEATTWWTPSWTEDVLQAIPVRYEEQRVGTEWCSSGRSWRSQGQKTTNKHITTQISRHTYSKKP